MRKLIYKNYLFSGQEVMVLAACAGISSLRMLMKNASGRAEAGEVSQTLFELCRRGMLLLEENGCCRLIGEAAVLFEQIRKARAELQICFGQSADMLHCFWDYEAVIAEISTADRDKIRLHGTTAGEFFTELCEKGIIPKKDYHQEENPEEWYEQMDVTESEEQEEWIFAAEACYREFLRNNPELTEGGISRYDTLLSVLKKGSELTAFIVVIDRKLEKNRSVILFLDGGMYDYAVLLDEENGWQECCFSNRIRKYLCEEVLHSEHETACFYEEAAGTDNRCPVYTIHENEVKGYDFS